MSLVPFSSILHSAVPFLLLCTVNPILSFSDLRFDDLLSFSSWKLALDPGNLVFRVFYLILFVFSVWDLLIAITHFLIAFMRLFGGALEMVDSILGNYFPCSFPRPQFRLAIARKSLVFSV